MGSYILDQKKGFYSFFLDMMRIGNFSKVNIWTKWQINKLCSFEMLRDCGWLKPCELPFVLVRCDVKTTTAEWAQCEHDEVKQVNRGFPSGFWQIQDLESIINKKHWRNKISLCGSCESTKIKKKKITFPGFKDWILGWISSPKDRKLVCSKFSTCFSVNIKNRNKHRPHQLFLRCSVGRFHFNVKDLSWSTTTAVPELRRNGCFKPEFTSKLLKFGQI